VSGQLNNGLFHRVPLIPHFHFPYEVLEASASLLEGAAIRHNRNTAMAADWVACWWHETSHFLQYTTYPPGIAAHTFEDQIHHSKVHIFKSHGRTHFSSDIYKNEYNRDEIDLAIWADYQLMNEHDWWQDLILKPGWYPIRRLLDFAQRIKRPVDVLTYDNGRNILSTLILPDEDDIEKARSAPSFELLLEIMSTRVELDFLKAKLGPTVRLSSTMGSVQGRYNRLIREAFSACTALDAADLRYPAILPVALVDLALTAPWLGFQAVSWAELSPSARFNRLLELTEELRRLRHLVCKSPIDVNAVFEEVSHLLCSTLGWHMPREVLQRARTSMGALYETPVPPEFGAYNRLIGDRIQMYLARKIEDLGFPLTAPHTVIFVQAPVQFFRATVVPGIRPSEKGELVSHLIHSVNLMTTSYLMSRNETTDHDVKLSRLAHQMAQEFFDQRTSPHLRGDLLDLFPRNYDDYVARLENGAYF
jgi:hypothetical protein